MTNFEADYIDYSVRYIKTSAKTGHCVCVAHMAHMAQAAGIRVLFTDTQLQ